MAMGIKPEQVSRWENGKASISEGNDRMLRMIYRASVEQPCSDVSAKDRVISFLTSLPSKRKQIDDSHVIELNLQEWMRPRTKYYPWEGEYSSCEKIDSLPRTLAIHAIKDVRGQGQQAVASPGLRCFLITFFGL